MFQQAAYRRSEVETSEIHDDKQHHHSIDSGSSGLTQGQSHNHSQGRKHQMVRQSQPSRKYCHNRVQDRENQDDVQFLSDGFHKNQCLNLKWWRIRPPPPLLSSIILRKQDSV